ncbi:MAG: CoA transferase [Rhodospirillales bacterium]|nr:CoA transferase [Rhodospirillales bacterium]
MNDIAQPTPQSSRTGPLRGLLVLDFGQAAVGPIAAEYLGMMGATVIKVESPAGDTVRRGVPTMRGTSTTFLGNNLGKFGIVLDLKKPEDKERAKRLIAVADALIENFRSSEVMVRLGLGYDVLRELNPGLIYVSSSAYGACGPLENMRSNEWLTEAFAGFTSVTGAPGTQGEFSRGSANLDWNGAMVNTVALLAGLLRRARGGGGGYYLTSQLGSSVYGSLSRVAEALVGGMPAGPLGSAAAFTAPDEVFATSDGYVAVSAITERCWLRLCTAIGQPGLAEDPRFRDNAARVSARQELSALLAGVFASATTASWCERLEAADVPCGAVPQKMTLLEAFEANPQIRHHQLLRRIPSHYGSLASQAPHWRFAQTPADIDGGPPLQGEHNQIVLENLGSKAELLDALEKIRARENV